MIDTNYEDMKKLVATQVCAQCGGELTIRTNPEKGGELEIWCPHHPDHHGYIERETYTQAFRRGAEVHPTIRDAIERKMVPKDDLGRAMNLLALRYPSAIVDPPTAALFILDCARLDIDPLISPAEAVPVPFKSKKKDEKGNVVEEKTTITMVITEDGWLSMAARGCKDDWVGPPRTMRLEEYLTSLPENKDKPREEVLAIAREIKESKCNDPDAWYYVAIGKRRGGEDTVIPGYFTHKDHGKAEKGYLPAATQPGNQARVRAIKRWVREVFPECRQKMIELTAEWYQRAEGIQAAQEYIDAEYTFISSETEGGEKIGEPAGKKVATATSTVQPKPKQVDWRALWARAKESGLSEDRVLKMLGVTSIKEWTDRGKTLDEAMEVISRTLSEPEAAKTDEVTGEGFSIDLQWLQDSQKAIKWTDDTMKTFLVGEYKISPEGTLTEMLARLTREQAEDFTQKINGRVEKQTRLF